MPNTILTPTMVLRKSLQILHNNLGFTKGVNRQFDDQFGGKGAKNGDTIKARLPNRATIRTGPTMAVQDTVEESVDIKCATMVGVDLTFSSAELTLELDDFAERVLKTPIAQLASKIDYLGLSLYKDIYNQVGTAGTTPQDALVYLLAGEKMNNSAAPRDDERYIAYSPKAEAYTVDGLKGLFQDSKSIADQYRNGVMGRGLGFKFMMDQNVNRHTTGTFTTGSVPVTDGVGVEGASTLATTGWVINTLVLKEGDVFTIANVYRVNPETYESTGELQQFVVTSDGTSDGAGDLTINISPSLITTGSKKTITALPATGIAIDVTDMGTEATQYPINMAYHKNAFCLVTADLEMPKGVDFAYREKFEGISMRIVRQYTISDDQFPCRIDVYHGWTTLRPELACRIIG